MSEPVDDSKNLSGPTTRMFQITEDDLAEVERLLPVLCEHLYPKLGKDAPGATKLRKQLGKLKEIISNIRWNYGPPLDVGIIPADGGD